MAKFDVHTAAEGQYLLDCQNDLLSDINTRFVVPLEAVADVVRVDRKLNPVLNVAGADMVMMTHFAAAVMVRCLGPKVASVADQDATISNALDFLISGF